MIRPLIVAASVLACLPALAETQVPTIPGKPANCRPAGDVMAAEAENANAPQRLSGDSYSAVREAFNAEPPRTDYGGPIWYKRMGDGVLLGMLNSDVKGYVCFLLVPQPKAQVFIDVMRPT